MYLVLIILPFRSALDVLYSDARRLEYFVYTNQANHWFYLRQHAILLFEVGQKQIARADLFQAYEVLSNWENPIHSRDPLPGDQEMDLFHAAKRVLQPIVKHFVNLE